MNSVKKQSVLITTTSISLLVAALSLILIRQQKNKSKKRSNVGCNNNERKMIQTITEYRPDDCKYEDEKSAVNKRHEQDDELSDEYDWSEDLPTHIQREQMKERRRQAKLPQMSMKSQMYDNVTMLDPQGNILSKISRKKGRWYVKRGLANWIREEAEEDSNAAYLYESSSTKMVVEVDDDSEFNTIQLKFEPKARSEKHEYGKSFKRNICVACGGTENQMRFYIVPYAYRNLFPKKYKSHISHDVVLLCANCHLTCGQQSQYRMNDMEEKFNVKKKHTTNFELYKVRSSSLALMNWRQKIPEEKIAEHESVVRTYFLKIGETIQNDEEISKEKLQRAIDVDYQIENPDYIPGPNLVVESLLGNDLKMEEFIRGWRRFFVDTIHPRHLPTGWSVDYPVMSNEE